MTYHLKKFLNRAYLEDKPYNDIVLPLEKQLSLNELGAPEETTLVPLNTVDVRYLEQKKKSNHRGYCFHCGRYGHYKGQCRKLKKGRYYETQAKNGEINSTDPRKPECETCGEVLGSSESRQRKKKRELAIPTNKISEH